MSLVKQRINIIDGIRGFSLLGILLANLLIFQFGIFGKDEIHYYKLSTVDTYAYYFTKVVIEGAFLPIFMFIFGYSLILMRNKLKERNKRVKWHLFRRFALLMTLGILHSTYLWEGDILFVYGLMGILLLVMVNRKPKTLLIWATLLFSLLFIGSLFEAEEIKMIRADKVDLYMKQTQEIYGSGTYSEIRAHSLDDEMLDMSGGEAAFMLLLTPFVLSPMFLIGMYAAHRKWLQNTSSKIKQFTILSGLLIPIGLLLKATPLLSKQWDYRLDMSMIGGSMLAIGYISLFVYLYNHQKLRRFLSGFESMGKLSLTNYLMQSMICTFLFYGYGLGWFGDLGIILATVVGVVIFGTQAFLSSVYLKHLPVGPVEYLVRLVVYLKIPKFKKHTSLEDDHRKAI